MSSQLQVSGEAKIRDIQGPVVANSGVITALDGAASQYVRGDGTLADFPTSNGGGSSVSYYLNSSVSQGTIGGVAYRELSKEPIIGAGTDIAISSNGYVANYITDANDPDVVLIPGGNFNCEFYFSVNNNTGNPFTYAELYKYDGTTFTLLGSSVGVPEYINQGTVINPYYFAIPVATATLALTDRLAIRIYVNVDGRTVTLHTENGHLCQVVTTLSKGMVSLNNLTDQSQFLAVGTSGTNFAIVSSGDTHTFNLPVASATNTGKLSSTDWSTFNGKYNLPSLTSGSVLFSNGTTIAQNNANFFWDNTNSFLGVGTNVPNANITSFSTTPAFQFKAAGVAPAITFSNTITSASLACVFGLATSNNQFVFGTATGDMAIANQSTSAGAIVFGTGTTERMRMTSAGTFSIGNTNSTYNLDVTGTARFTGELTGSSAVFSSTVRPSSSFGANLGTSSFRWNDIFGFSLTLTSSVTALSIIKSGGTSSQFLMADGSVNTSVLPSGAYLPLTGGTLTGALSGTSATFSGLTQDAVQTVIRMAGKNASSQIKALDFKLTAGTPLWTISTAAEGTDAGINIMPNGSAGLSLAYTGAATFSSSVNIRTTASFTYGTLTVVQDSVSAPSFVRGIQIVHPNGTGATGGYISMSNLGSNLGGIQVGTDTLVGSLILNPAGGNVGIGTSSPDTIAGDVRTLSLSGTSANISGGISYQVNGSVKMYHYIDSDGLFLHQAISGVGQKFFTNNTERMRITSAGAVLMGTTTSTNGTLVTTSTASTFGIAIRDEANSGNMVSFKNNGGAQVGSITHNGTTTSYNTTSDYRLKQDLKDYSGLDLVSAIKTYDYEWKSDKSRMYGVIAHELAEVLPYAITGEKDAKDMQGVDYSKIVPILIKSIQELEAKIVTLESKLN